MWRYVKIPKAIALLAFLLPWMTVSCSSTRVAEANGWELVLGRIRPVMQSATEAAPHADKINIYLAAAVALIVVGLILSLARKRMAAVVVATSLGALALIWAGAQQYTPQRLAEAAAKSGKDMNMDQIGTSLIRVDWQIGYWVALIALAVAAILAFLAIRDPDTP
jgi:disulfide bond formation protein DsbB